MSPHRRQSDEYLLAFRAWVERRMRKAAYAFLILAVANAVAIAWIYDTRTHGNIKDKAQAKEISRQQRDIASLLVQVQRGRKTTLLKICAIDNGQNRAIRKILRKAKIDAAPFRAISCNKLLVSAHTQRKPSVSRQTKANGG